jgi:hypothetical protein
MLQYESCGLLAGSYSFLNTWKIFRLILNTCIHRMDTQMEMPTDESLVPGFTTFDVAIAKFYKV